MVARTYDLFPKAGNDLEHIIEWYEQLSQGVGILFLKEFEQSLIEIIKTPQANKLATAHIRRYLMKKFPYIIYYVIDLDVITVLRVRGKRQRPLKRYV